MWLEIVKNEKLNKYVLISALCQVPASKWIASVDQTEKTPALQGLIFSK